MKQQLRGKELFLVGVTLLFSMFLAQATDFPPFGWAIRPALSPPPFWVWP